MTAYFKKLLVDVDGVLTPGTFLYTRFGKVAKEFGPHDADGRKLLGELGISVIAVSADRRGAPITRKRMKDMGIPFWVLDDVERRSRLEAMLTWGPTAYVGDSYNDVDLLRIATESFAPSDASRPARLAAKTLLETPGGRGVLLEIALRVMEKW